MKSYKQNLKRRLLTAVGEFDDTLLAADHREFDLMISRSGSECLSDTELMAYFFLFRCEATYEEACRKLNECNERRYPVATVIKYSRRAIDRIATHVHKDKRLSGWIRRHKNLKSRTEK